MIGRPTKITFAEMREMGVRGLLIYCAEYRCSSSIAVNADQWPDDVRLSDIEARFICNACGHRGADVRPDLRPNVSSVSGDGCPANLKVGPESIHIRERTAIRCRRSSLGDLVPLSRR
jgi:hypothetical protein